MDSNNLGKNKFELPVFILSILAPLIVILCFIAYEIAMVNFGTKVSLVATGYDPKDFLRGHYISYKLLAKDIDVFDIETIPKFDDSFSRTVIDAYITLKDTDNDGIYDSVDKLHINEPDSPYIKSSCVYYYDRDDETTPIVIVNDVQRKYYLNENLAPIVENEINEAGEFEVFGTIHNGYFRSKNIVVDGKNY